MRAWVGIHGNPESSNRHQSTLHWETQWRFLPTSFLTNANKEGGKGEEQTAMQKQDLELETTARPPRPSTRYLKLGKNPHVK